MLGLGLLVLQAVAATNAPAEPSPSTNLIAVVALPKSTFISDPNQGRDPFYPAARIIPTTNGPPPKGELKLRAILGTSRRRLALIGNQTFEKGEKAAVKLGETRVMVHCLDITDRTVVITLEGNPERKELRLE